MHQWKPFFDLLVKKIESIAIWVRVANIPLELMNPEFLHSVGDNLGTLFKIGIKTIHHTTGRCARLCIQMNLDRPLKTFIEVEGRRFHLEYEGINMICFDCGKVGHNKESCQVLKADSLPENL